MTNNLKFKQVPFWSLFERTKRIGFPDEDLLSVYRAFGVIRKDDRDDNHNRAGHDLGSYQLVEQSDLVLNKMKTWQGSLGISPFRGIVSPAYFVYRPLTQNDSRFLHYALRSPEYIKFYAANSKGVRPGQWDLQPEQLDLMKVALPPLDTQRAIADYLNRETSEIDAMLEKLEGLSQLLEERFHQQLVKAIRGTSAPFIELGVVADIALGKMIQPNKKNPSDVQANYLRAAHVQPGGRLDFDVAEQQMWFDPAELSRLDLRAGDVVIVEGGAGYGRSAHLETNLVNWGFQNSINRVRPHTNKLIGKFIHYALHLALISGEIEMEVNTATIPHFTAEKVARFRIPLPLFDEQKKIVKHLDETIARIENMKNKVATLRSLLQERRSALITAAVTGQIEV